MNHAINEPAPEWDVALEASWEFMAECELPDPEHGDEG